MIRWKARRRTLAAGAVGLAASALVVVSGGPSQAEGPYYFNCVGPLADGKTVAAFVSVSSKELRVGQQLSVNWQLGEPQSPLHVPNPLDGNLDKGAHLAVTARVKATGIWTGQGDIDSVGTTLLTADRMRDDPPLEFGEVLPGLATAERAGTGSIAVDSIILDLAPVEATWNNDFSPVGDFSVDYEPGWAKVPDPAAYDGKTHFGQDYREASQEGDKASFTFVGTGVDLISDKNLDMGFVRLTTDNGYPPNEARVEHNAYWSTQGERRVGEVFEAAKDLPYGKYTLTVENRTQNKFARVDAFRVHAGTANNFAASRYRTVCTAQKPFPLIPIKVTTGGGTGSSPSASVEPSQSPDSSASPSGSASVSPSVTPSATPSKSPSGDQSPSPSPSPSASPSPAAAATQNYVVAVVPQGSPSPTATRTVTLTATPTVAQVAVTPQGGAQTGEAPERVSSSGMLLIGSGGALLMIGMLSGVALLRRRAAHSGERG
ncbi:hypothetical protein [Microbispora sp. NPDC046933]|uniref:hypothetical protein n=1 Tax=Microbispora sp. NPDC046933 TaxID=3155618 RepID=UPI0033EB329A